MVVWLPFISKTVKTRNPTTIFWRFMDACNHDFSFGSPRILWKGLTRNVYLYTFKLVFFAMYYTPNIQLAFKITEHIIRRVNFGWILRNTHSNTASLFFTVVHMHIFDGYILAQMQNLSNDVKHRNFKEHSVVITFVSAFFVSIKFGLEILVN